MFINRKSFYIAIGEKIVNFIDFFGGLFSLSIQTIIQIPARPFGARRIFEQAKKVGVDSLPIVLLVQFFIGMIMALQTAYIMQKMSSEIYIASIVAVSLTRELGPVITALIVAGRSGAGITAELGTMSVTEQVDALVTLGSNPIKYLVVPRYLSMTFMLPILTIFANAVGIYGGYLICVYRLSIRSSMYLNMTFQSLVYKDLYTGLIKTLFFGMIIALVACYEGLNVRGGAEGVGKATTKSVVNTFILIIVADCFFTALFYFFWV
ncbi:MAG TPA: ABC transporter permease [Candidatus Omnitrophica bacterium]|nr:ABC transporter permease [Candidatus Omnitrophota bacterium]